MIRLRIRTLKRMRYTYRRILQQEVPVDRVLALH
jgi:hypothetical protein